MRNIKTLSLSNLSNVTGGCGGGGCCGNECNQQQQNQTVINNNVTNNYAAPRWHRPRGGNLDVTVATGGAAAQAMSAG